MSDLADKVGLVTAGATGIGFACARAIVDGGGKVMICARREDTLRDAVQSLGENAAWVSDPLWPESENSSLPATASHTRAVLSKLAVTMPRFALRGGRPHH